MTPPDFPGSGSRGHLRTRRDLGEHLLQHGQARLRPGRPQALRHRFQRTGCGPSGLRLRRLRPAHLHPAGRLQPAHPSPLRQRPSRASRSATAATSTSISRGSGAIPPNPSFPFYVYGYEPQRRRARRQLPDRHFGPSRRRAGGRPARRRRCRLLRQPLGRQQLDRHDPQVQLGAAPSRPRSTSPPTAAPATSPSTPPTISTSPRMASGATPAPTYTAATQIVPSGSSAAIAVDPSNDHLYVASLQQGRRVRLLRQSPQRASPPVSRGSVASPSTPPTTTSTSPTNVPDPRLPSRRYPEAPDPHPGRRERDHRLLGHPQRQGRPRGLRGHRLPLRLRHGPRLRRRRRQPLRRREARRPAPRPRLGLRRRRRPRRPQRPKRRHHLPLPHRRLKRPARRHRRGLRSDLHHPRPGDLGAPRPTTSPTPPPLCTPRSTPRAKTPPTASSTSPTPTSKRTASAAPRALPPTPPTSATATSRFPSIEQIGGLQPDTTYHYRVVASNSDGTNLGPDAHLRHLPGDTRLQRR